MNVLSSMGGSLKWMAVDERESDFAGAFFAAYTSLSGFEKSYIGKNIELGALASKDFVRVRPFVGTGILFASGEVPANLATRPAERAGSHYTVHSFLGCEIQLPITITIQIDLMNLTPIATLLIGKTL